MVRTQKSLQLKAWRPRPAEGGGKKGGGRKEGEELKHDHDDHLCFLLRYVRPTERKGLAPLKWNRVKREEKKEEHSPTSILISPLRESLKQQTDRKKGGGKRGEKDKQRPRFLL